MNRKPVLSIAHSPDPDDAFMFYGIAEGGLSYPGHTVRHVMKDIQTLNREARKARHHMTAISAAAYPSVAKDYWVLSVGASVGRKYGPMVVCLPEKKALFQKRDWSGLRIATPGPETTALLSLRLARSGFTPVDTPFDKILDAVRRKKTDGGLIIHEGQLTFAQHGLVKVLDLGRWWHRETGLPLPLGLDVVRKDLGLPQARALARLLRDSIRLAYANKKDAVRYALRFGRGIDARVGERFVKMYVNRDTLDLGPQGEKALRLLYARAQERKWLQRVPAFRVIRP